MSKPTPVSLDRQHNIFAHGQLIYEMEVDYSLKRATALLEPLLMLVIGIAVGAMVVIKITPIYSIVGGLQKGF